MNTKLLTKYHLQPLSLKGGGTGWSEYTLVKMPQKLQFGNNMLALVLKLHTL